jgi:hypothetical protein
VRLVDTYSTPAARASVNKNASICAVRLSLLCSLLDVMAVNAFANCGVDVWAVHCAALLPYSFRHMPSIHLYDLFTSLRRFSSADVFFLGWPTLSAFGGPAAADFVDVSPVVGTSSVD